MCFGKRIFGSQINRAVNPTPSQDSVQLPNIIDPGFQVFIDFILANVHSDERPYLNVEVFGHTLLGLLDSGASKTIIGSRGYDIFKQFNLKSRRL